MSEREASMIARAISEGLHEISRMSITRCEHSWKKPESCMSISATALTQECKHCKKVRRV